MNELFKNDITLDQENHKYILDSSPEFKFSSVTEFIHFFFEKFDQEKVATKLINTNPKYSGKTLNEILKEVIVYSKELGIAGTIDLLVYNSEQNMYHLVDWKTNKRIDKNSFRNKKGILSSSQHLDDCNFVNYSLQLSFYRYILERYYGLEVGSQTLFHLKENDTYEIFNVDYKSEDLINMLREKELI